MRVRTPGGATAVLVVSALLLSACASPPPTSGTPEVPSLYQIRPPDMLRITVRPEPEIRRDVLVRPDGWISFDLIGEVYVQGKTIDDVRSEVRQRMT